MKKAHLLSREAARKLRERSKLFHKPSLPSPSRDGSASPSVWTLSPAAQKFVRNAMGKSSSSIDETLHASYRGSSPGFTTPKGGRSVSRLRSHASIVLRSPSAAREGTNQYADILIKDQFVTILNLVTQVKIAGGY
ncbi:hypothetical protein EV1_030094 [Malus domestica]